MVPIIVLTAALLMICVERARPGRVFPQVADWLRRAWVVSLLQALVVLLFGVTFDRWLAGLRWFHFDTRSHVLPVLLGYVATTFVFYWWHRARHGSDMLWRWVHQLHHSPQRLEVITSFYKHPLEILLNSVLTGSVLYLGCGLTPACAAASLTLCGLAELFYHWNVATPRWLGWFVQRPEMHCEHHREGAHRYNYGDLPLWDWLFGTYYNPPRFEGRCGFGADESRLAELLRAREVAK